MPRAIGIEWIQHWFDDYLSDELIMASSFSEWMWCPERYLDSELNEMAIMWKERQLRISHGPAGEHAVECFRKSLGA